MAKNTEISLRNKVIYSVYVRNHTNDGTFNAVADDLDRIKSLGTDIIWFMPIHPIGVKNKKGSLGCPYANKDYRTTNPEYGTMDDFKSLVEKIHQWTEQQTKQNETCRNCENRNDNDNIKTQNESNETTEDDTENIVEIKDEDNESWSE